MTGRQALYDRLLNELNNPIRDPQELEKTINALNIRMGSFGIERKHIINNLFKNIIEMSLPHFVKYLFWGSNENKGIFISEADQIENFEKKRKMSKYQLEELKNKEGLDDWESINELLDLTPEQLAKFR
mmetsp:Transcript_1766/g.1681  ORF Transcript_1766/g.1681 Transcript_1766/m.1681 type:complete len:129 (-) Transcript_1766:228-614(-)